MLTAENTRIRTLLVEDDTADALLVERVLRDDPQMSRDITHVSCWEAARAQLCSHRFDVVLLDLGLPDVEPRTLIEQAVPAAGPAAVVVLTDLDDDGVALEALHHGAQDYLRKGDGPRLLLRTLRYAIERRQNRSQLEEMQRRQLELKDEFLSHVSHELRTPLTAIYQFVTILQDGIAGELTDDQREYLGIVHRNVKQLRNMIDDLMEVTRAQTGKLTVAPVPYRLEPSIEDTIESLRASADEKRIALITDLAGGLPRVLADESRVRQVLTNLLANALRFTPEEGRICVRTRLWPDDPEFLQVSVQDTGCGISPEGLRAVFERLHQEGGDDENSRKGLGLGLYISQELVTRMGGRIWADSTLGCGSEFHFTLPCFSVQRLIWQVVNPDKGAPPSRLSLVCTEIGPSDPEATLRLPATVLDQAYEIHRSCAQRYQDAIFPRSGLDCVWERFYVLAATDDPGCATLSRRLTDAMERLGLDELCARAQIRWEPIELGPELEGPLARAEACAQRVMERIHADRA